MNSIAFGFQYGVRRLDDNACRVQVCDAKAPLTIAGYPVEVSSFLPTSKQVPQIKKWPRKNRPDKIRIRYKTVETHAVLIAGVLCVSKKGLTILEDLKGRQ